MANQISKYTSTKDLKITYLLGAGASYGSIPILSNMGNAMIEVSNHIGTAIQPSLDFGDVIVDLSSPEGEFLVKQEEKLPYFGAKAIEFGSLDIYARRLYLLGHNKELEELKFSLSLYFDLWQRFVYRKQIIKEKLNYSSIDKRYFSLLSVILNKTNNLPTLNSNVSFISWNYDLQLERTYSSFLPIENGNSIINVNDSFNFIPDRNEDKQEVIHLNGFSGIYSSNDKLIELVDKNVSSISSYLLSFAKKYLEIQGNGEQVNTSIKYAWEENHTLVEKAKKVMSSTNILIMIGYSFPSFNRVVDSQLIKEFENKSGVKHVIYQDPNANKDLVESLFSNPKNVVINKNEIGQFPIPHEFLFPRPAQKMIF